MATAAQALQHRADLAALVGIAENDLRVLWRQLDSPVAAREALMDVLPSLATVYGAAAATLGADWYDEVREAGEVRGRFRAITADLGDLGTDELARWGIGPLFATNPDWDSALSLITGGLQRRIANASRDSVTGSSYADPSADGWQRVTAGGCAFCRTLEGRGVVYSEASADFASHDNCNCVAAPAFSGKERPVKPYTPSSRNITDADRARVREYIRTH